MPILETKSKFHNVLETSDSAKSSRTPRRPRVAVLGAPLENTSPLKGLADSVDAIRAIDLEEAARLLQAGECDAAMVTPAGADQLNENASPNALLGSEQILNRIAHGIALVDQELRIVWNNPAFADLCDHPVSMGTRIYDALDCLEIQGPAFCPFTDCLGGAAQAHSRLRLLSGRRLEIVVQPLPTPAGNASTPANVHAPRLLCCLRDVTNEYRQREKLIAIHRAGLELSHLTYDELNRMSTAERIDLLKANILHYSQRILNFKNLEIRLLDPKTKILTTLLSEGMTEPAGRRVLRADPEGNGVTGFVAATGVSYLCDDVLHDALYLPGAKDARSSLTVPIVYRDRVIGTFNVESPEPSNFTESDREFLEVFAREIAVALNTLELLQAEKRFGGTATVEAIVNEVSLPADEIVASAMRLLEALERHGDAAGERERETVRRVIENARAIKSAIQSVGRSYAPERAEQATAPASKASPCAGKRVLVADDDPVIRRAAHKLLGRLDCEVDTAKDGQEAMTLARSGEYDVVLGDIRLPDMNGYEFFGNMRQASPRSSIVMMTGFGYDAAHSIVKARQEGLRAVLYKPFRLDRLREAIEDAIDPQLAQQREREARARAACAPTKQSVL